MTMDVERFRTRRSVSIGSTSSSDDDDDEEDDDDDDDEEDEPLLEDDDDDDKGKRKGAVIRTAPKPVGISLAFVDNDGTTSLLRCYDTVEPPEPEANRYQVQ